MRPGRLDRILYVGPPDTSARRQILQVNLRRIPHKLEENDIITLADKVTLVVFLLLDSLKFCS